MPIYSLVVMAVALYVMGRAARIIGSSVKAAATRFGMSDFVVAFLLLGFATSLPEISVAVFSAAEGNPGLSLGNLLGANIVILSLLIGLTAVLGKKISPVDLYRRRVFPLFLLDILLPVYAVADGRLTRIDGVFLTVAHIVFAGYLYRTHISETVGAPLESGMQTRSMKKVALKGFGALALLLGASYILVHSAIAMAAVIGTPPLIIGLLFFSLGTNAPELTFVLTQARGPNRNIVFGDLFGSLLVNTPTLGLLALISPYTFANPTPVLVSAGILFVLASVFGIFLWTKRALTRFEGAVLLGFYVAYLLYYATYL